MEGAVMLWMFTIMGLIVGGIIIGAVWDNTRGDQ